MFEDDYGFINPIEFKCKDIHITEPKFDKKVDKKFDYELERFIDRNNCIKNMNEYVKKNKIKNYGFDEEIKELIKGLNRVKKNNVLLLGKPGIGKTALVEKLCELINQEKVPDILKNKTILEINMVGLEAGTQYRGSMEKKVQDIFNFIMDRDDIIIFIDEIHNILRCGKSEGSSGLGDMLKPYMARNELTLIGATTIEEYEETISKNGAMDRRFCKLYMDEPDEKKLLLILEKSKTQYEKHYNIKLSKNDIVKVIELSKSRQGSFPDKAFDELEDYCYEKVEEVKE